MNAVLECEQGNQGKRLVNLEGEAAGSQSGQWTGLIDKQKPLPTHEKAVEGKQRLRRIGRRGAVPREVGGATSGP